MHISKNTPTNRDRREKVSGALSCYAEDGDEEAGLSDILVDAMHLFGAEAVSQALVAAEVNYNEER